jgi:glycosyltransferase involved in cell wall biosynthesis
MSRATDELTVMQVLLDLDPGGCERVVVELTRHLLPVGRVVVCCLDYAGRWAKDLEAMGVKVYALNRSPGFQPSLGRRLASLAAQHQVDVLHCHQYSPFVYGVLAGFLRPRLRLIYTEHGRRSEHDLSTKRRLVNAVFSRRPSHCVAVSAELREYMIAEGVPGRKLSVIRNGIDPGPASSPVRRAEAREQLGLAPGAYVVGTVAGLRPVKDLGTLIEAFCGISSDLPNATLIIVGEGSERKNLESLVESKGVGDRVVLAGFRERPADLLPAFDVFVNSSITEGISITLLEAMAAELPVIATRVGGTPELVLDGQTGVLVASRNPRALSLQLLEMARSPELGRKYGAAGRRRVEGEFSLDKMVDSYLRIYRAS